LILNVVPKELDVVFQLRCAHDTKFYFFFYVLKIKKHESQGKDGVNPAARPRIGAPATRFGLWGFVRPVFQGGRVPGARASLFTGAIGHNTVQLSSVRSDFDRLNLDEYSCNYQDRIDIKPAQRLFALFDPVPAFPRKRGKAQNP
jgi:hypothetical protein